MSTLADIKLLIDTNLPDNTTGLITPAKERQVMKAIADFVVSSQGEVDTATFVYDPAFSYAIDAPVIYLNAWYLSLAASNLNNQPDISPLSWDPVNAFNTVLSIWELDAVYLGELTIVIKDNKLYLLDRAVVGTQPFVSIDFAAELAAGKWINLLPDTTPVANTYADDAAMIAAQALQVSGYFYKAGTSLYIYLGTPTASITDYYKVTGTAATPTPPVAAIYADTAAMIAAQGVQITDYLYKAGAEYYHYLGTTVGDITDYTAIGSTGPQGPAGPTGATGATGPQGPAGAGVVDNFTPQAGTVLAFDGPNKYGFNGTPLTANLTFSITGAKETVMIKARHNAGTAPTLTPPGGVTLIKEGADYTVSVDNILYAVCHKNDAGAVTHISYSWTKNQP